MKKRSLSSFPVFLIITFFAAFSLKIQSANAIPSWHVDWLILELPDPKDPPTKEEIDEIVKRAQQDDWIARQQLATAFLYETWKTGKLDRGCENLKNGYYCRALAARGHEGEIHLKDLINLPATGPIPVERLARYQVDFAIKLFRDSAPTYDKDSPTCRAAVATLKKAIENELLVSNQTNSCAARRLAYHYQFGSCTPKDPQKSKELFLRSGACPVT
ncbi:hypothetical protein HNP48_001287 [Acidovorax soli]|uniref:Sel1 repeat-containing protein n=1 Tax=Acidovorax soli TaxID=592050 RepID=A0A7X0PB39_9BURK|nr:SEL1-like repeat protein [Acidovorax soli]MBB6558623.1 hypothetical protein [Acidovorax soli]